MLRVCADTGDTFKVTACLIVLEDKNTPEGFVFTEPSGGVGATGDYSSSVSLNCY